MKKQLLALVVGLACVVPAYAEVELKDMKNVIDEIKNLGVLSEKTVTDILNQDSDSLSLDWVAAAADVQRIIDNIVTHFPQLLQIAQDALQDSSLKNLPGSLGAQVKPIREALFGSLQEIPSKLRAIRPYITGENAAMVVNAIQRSGQLPLLKEVLSNVNAKGENFYQAKIAKSMDRLTAIDLQKVVTNINTLLTEGGVVASAKVMLAFAKIVPALTTIVKNTATLALIMADKVAETSYVNPETGKTPGLDPEVKAAIDAVKAQAQNAINAVDTINKKFAGLLG